MAGISRDVGDNQRGQHAEHRRAQPVKQLYCNDQIRIGGAGEQDAADRQGVKP